MKYFVWILLLSVSATAGEYVVLQNGSRIEAESHEEVEDKIVLHMKDGGTIEIAAAIVADIEPDPAPAPVLAAAKKGSKKERSKPEPVDPHKLIDEAATRYGLPPEIVHSIAVIESGYKVNAKSPKGALGLMQLMPSTAKYLNADPRDPRQNVEAGTRYLRDLLLKFKNDPDPVHRAIAAYNAGPGAVKKFNGIPPYRETQQYVKKVLKQYQQRVAAAEAAEQEDSPALPDSGADSPVHALTGN